MKKPASKKKKKRSGRKRSQGDAGTQAPSSEAVAPAAEEPQEKPNSEQKRVSVPPTPKRDADKRSEKKKEDKKSIGSYVSMATTFLREARVELRKVKWPTRKELLASTAMVILLVLIAALFLGVIDFGLIKIIRTVVG
jgi:preprotein translocase subunit SecE